MYDKFSSRRAGQSGFTLMELLVVLVIMGFLLGMIVPRLGSVADSAVDTVCDSNNKGVRYFTKLFLDEKGRLPSGLTNLVVSDGTAFIADYDDDTTDVVDKSKMKSDMDPSNGADFFAPDFVERNGVTLHTLTADEATELKKMGISYVLNLVGENRPMERQAIEAGAPVAMAGTIADTFDAGNFPEGNPFWYGRILLGVGEQSELVTAGFIQAAALCPGGIQQQDNVTYNNYVVVLPRLKATVDDLGSWVLDGTDPATLYALDAEDADGELREFTIAAQEKWEFDFSCPEGHKWPDNDNDTWTVSTTAP